MIVIKTVNKLDQNEEKLDKLLKERKKLCKQLAKEVYEKYGDKIENKEQVAQVEPAVWEDKYEDPTWKEATIYVTLSRDLFIDKLGYDPTEKEYSSEVYNEVSEIEDNFTENFTFPLEQKIREKYDSENFWFELRVKDPTKVLA